MNLNPIYVVSSEQGTSTMYDKVTHARKELMYLKRLGYSGLAIRVVRETDLIEQMEATQ